MAPLDVRSWTTDQATLPRFTEAAALTRTLRRTILFYLLLVALSAIGGGLLPLPSGLRAATPLLRDAPLGGTLGAMFGSLLIALAALIPCALIVGQRATLIGQSSLEPHARRFNALRRGLARLRAASWPHGLLTFAVAAAAGYAAWHFGHVHGAPLGEPTRRLAVGGTLAVAAFPLLVVERFFARVAPTALPEAAGLAGLLYVPVAVVLACGLLEIAAGLGIGTAIVTWLETGLAIYVAAVAAELAIRALPVLVAPAAPPHVARAAVGSVLAKLLRPRSLSAGVISGAVKQQFGLDFSRSWAIRFVQGAFMPVLVSSALFCWFLSGVVAVGLDQRGAYERFGEPAGILQSGLHLVLPWPLGTVRKVEHGVVHSVTIGDVETVMAAAPGALFLRRQRVRSRRRTSRPRVPTGYGTSRVSRKYPTSSPAPARIVRVSK